jgi:hypothetical protein
LNGRRLGEREKEEHERGQAEVFSSGANGRAVARIWSQG